MFSALWLAKTLSGFEINSLEACLPQVTCDNTPLCYTLSDFVCPRLFAFSARVGACGSTPVYVGKGNIRQRLRSMIWKQWKRGRVRYLELRRRGVSGPLAAQTAGSSDGPWHLADSPALKYALPIAYFDSLGLPRLCDDFA